jgi:cell division protein FtsL
MWDKILEFGKELLTLKRQVGSNTSDIQELQKDLKELTSAVREL